MRRIQSQRLSKLFSNSALIPTMATCSHLAAVVCHGSYHTPAPYGPLLEALQARGIAAYCPHLPTADLAKLNVGDVANPDFNREPPPGGYPQGEEDTAAVLSALKPLVEAGKEVIIVGHSSGGWVATQAAQPDLQAKVRKSQGLLGGVVGILYAGAFVIPVGESVTTFFQPKDGNFVTPPFMTFHVSISYFDAVAVMVTMYLTCKTEKRSRRTRHDCRRRKVPL
jgi:pimeloyl-ACP methyl ester carboxylesterase